MLPQAQRQGLADAPLNGLRPTNVPARSLNAQAACNVAAVPGLALLGFISHEGQRRLLLDSPCLAVGALPVQPRLSLAPGTEDNSRLSAVVSLTKSRKPGYTRRLNSSIAQSVERRTVNP